MRILNFFEIFCGCGSSGNSPPPQKRKSCSRHSPERNCGDNLYESRGSGRKLGEVSAVPKRSLSKRGRTQKHANARKRAQTQVHKSAQESATGRKRAQKSASSYKLQTTRFETKRFGNCQKLLGHFHASFAVQNVTHNGDNDKFAFYPVKQGLCWSDPAKTTKLTQMAGVTRAKARFTKGTFFVPCAQALVIARNLGHLIRSEVWRAGFMESRPEDFLNVGVSRFGFFWVCRFILRAIFHLRVRKP